MADHVGNSEEQLGCGEQEDEGNGFERQCMVNTSKCQYCTRNCVGNTGGSEPPVDV